MKEISRRSALAAVLGAALWTTDVLGQERDLQVEAVPPHRRPGHRPHPAHHPAHLRPVQVSLMPVGPSTLSIGQPLRFRMVSLAESYGHLYVFSASGRSQLWMENVRLHAGAPYVYPSPGRIVRAAAPAGDDTVMFVATRNRIAGFLGGGRTSTTPFDLQYSHDAMKSALQAQLDALSREDWAIAETTIRIND